ncbi:MAG TPA: hypothetical protein VEX70_00950 [Pyrinomonadaceae bacterium]|nr:hypothetical protein [Pyrinomonadaceae bacterium]
MDEVVDAVSRIANEIRKEANMENITGAETPSPEQVDAEMMAKFERHIEEKKERARRVGSLEGCSSARITVGKFDYKLNAWIRGDMVRIYITPHGEKES